MTNLEVMERAIDYTNEVWINECTRTGKSAGMSESELMYSAIGYSGRALMAVLNAPDGMCTAYTRQGNLRYDIAGLGKDGIKTELLKNAVNVATYHRVKDMRAGNQISNVFGDTLTDDQITVVLLNNLMDSGVERGYELLNDPKILESLCRSFADYRRKDKKQEIDAIASSNSVAYQLRDEIDVYYARYGDRPKYDNVPTGYGGK